MHCLCIFASFSHYECRLPDYSLFQPPALGAKLILHNYTDISGLVLIHLPALIAVQRKIDLSDEPIYSDAEMMLIKHVKKRVNRVC